MTLTITDLVEEAKARLQEREMRLFFLMEKTDHDPRGLELANRRGNYLTLLDEPGQPDAVRLLRFDERGFIGHSVYRDAASALEDALREGYTDEVPGTLDRLSVTPLWQHSTAMLELFHALNDGTITDDEARQRRTEIDRRFNLGNNGTDQSTSPAPQPPQE